MFAAVQAPGTYSFTQLEQLWIDNGGNAILAPVMAAIALAESSGNPNAQNPYDNNGAQTSWGLWQISDGTHNALPNWNDPNVNAQYAVGKLQSQGLGAWGTFTSGAYLNYAPPGMAAQVATIGAAFAHTASSLSSGGGAALNSAAGVDGVIGGAPIAGAPWNANTKKIVVTCAVLVLAFLLWRALP